MTPLLMWAVAAATTHAADIEKRRTGVGAAAALTSRQDVQGGATVSLRLQDSLIVRLQAPLTGTVRVAPGWGAGVDGLFRTAPALTANGATLHVRFGGGLMVGTDRYGVETLAVLQGVGGAEVHLGDTPWALELEARPQLVLAPYLAVDLGIALGGTRWF